MYRLKPNLKGGVIYEAIYELILYPSMFKLPDIVDICQSIDCNYIIILHDKDVDDNGVLKLEHFHCLVKFENRRSIKSVASAFGVGFQLVQWKSNFKASALYLFHRTAQSSGKYQYDFSSAITNVDNLEEWLTSSASLNDTEASQVKLLLDYIQQFNVSSMQYLMEFALQNNCYSALRRSSSIFRQALQEQKAYSYVNDEQNFRQF